MAKNDAKSKGIVNAPLLLLWIVMHDGAKHTSTFLFFRLQCDFKRVMIQKSKQQESWPERRKSAPLAAKKHTINILSRDTISFLEHRNGIVFSAISKPNGIFGFGVYIIYCAFWMLLPSCKINTNTQNQDEGDEKSWLVWLVKSCLFYAGNKASAWFYRTKWPPRTFADLTCSCSLANNSAFCLVWALKLKEEGYGACN